MCKNFKIWEHFVENKFAEKLAKFCRKKENLGKCYKIMLKIRDTARKFAKFLNNVRKF